MSSRFSPDVPLNEVVDIIHEYAATNSHKKGIPFVDLCKLISICTKNIQFLFNGWHYHQIDGIAMDSPLGPLLADIFMAHLEQRALNIITKMSFYKGYLDDILVVHESTERIQIACVVLNLMHLNIRLTSELELANCSSFLNILLTRRVDLTYISQENMKRFVHIS